MEFKYAARSKDGHIQKGTVESQSKRDAIAELHSRNLVILDLSQGTRAGNILSYQIGIFNRVRGKEMVSFSRQLATLFSAKISLLESLRALARQTANKYFSKVLFDIASEVEGGSLLSKAMAKHPKVFSAFFINMIRSGEAAGGLDRSLNYLADYLEKQYYINSKVKGAMIYPAFILGGFLVVAVLMMVIVVPQLTSFLTETGQKLPLTTRVLIGASDLIKEWGWLMLIVLVALVVGAVMSVNRVPSARRFWDLLKIKVPIVKKIFFGLYLARITDNLSSLIQGGLPILQALQISGEVVGNTIYKEILLEAKENVRVGNSMSSCFEKHKEIPPMVVQMVATGEQTGSVDEILKKLSVFYTKEVDAMVGTISQMIEPVLIVVLGIGVALLVSSILLPIYNIAGGM